MLLPAVSFYWLKQHKKHNIVKLIL